MKRALICVFSISLFFSCSNERVVYPYVLQATEIFLSYNLDSDVKVPLLIRRSTADKEYLYFQNGSRPELLIYDIYNGSMVKRNTYEVEGANAIKGGFLNGFMMLDCNQIFISGLADGSLYKTDSTGIVKFEMDISNRLDGYTLLPCFKDNGSMQVIGNKIYLPQSLNWQMGNKVVKNSPLLFCVDMVSGDVEPLPVVFPEQLFDVRIERGTSATIVSEYKCCYNGRQLVYSFAYMEDLMVVDPITFHVEYKSGKSQYIDDIESPFIRNTDERLVQRKICESPAYGNIIYDNENKVYYRIVYVPQEIERDVNMLALLHCGRKQFSIMIYDEDFNIIGEQLFPSYTYNPRLCFVSKGNLYISTNHVMNPNYSDDVLCFQKMELIKREF